MGHYDSSREADAEEASLRRENELYKCVERVNQLMEKLPKDTPPRFKDSLEDLRNWLLVEWRWDSLLRKDRRIK